MDTTQKSFENFCRLPKGHLADLLRVGLKLGFADEFVKTKGVFVSLRTTVTKKPSGRFAYGPLGECAETLLVDPGYQLTRFVYYKEASHVAIIDTVCNQVAFFQALRKLGFVE